MVTRRDVGKIVLAAGQARPVQGQRGPGQPVVRALAQGQHLVRREPQHQHRRLEEIGLGWLGQATAGDDPGGEAEARLLGRAGLPEDPGAPGPEHQPAQEPQHPQPLLGPGRALARAQMPAQRGERPHLAQLAQEPERLGRHPRGAVHQQALTAGQAHIEAEPLAGVEDDDPETSHRPPSRDQARTATGSARVFWSWLSSWAV